MPPGPLLAIWGMETGFGAVRGNVNTLSAVATLAYDCRRSEYFTDQLYAALTLVDRGLLTSNTRGAAHGEVGHTQFLPKNVLAYGTGDLNNVGAALSSTANFLKAPWLARRRGLPARRAELRGDPGLERRPGLRAGDRAARAPDRQRLVAHRPQSADEDCNQ